MTYAQGRAALAQTELFGPIIRQVGRCLLKPEKREPYEALVRAIAHQQVHGRAAEAMLGRLLLLYPHADFPPPTALLDAGPDKLRACGFSAAKCASILDIAEKSAAGWVPTRRAAMRLSDEELIERLVALRGVGRWTVEMLLIFTLGRMDVLPVDDFGVREGYRMALKLETQPKPKELAAVGAAWAPFRSVAAWYLWRNVDLERKMKMVAP
ncbi:DNA-3-methyladenine glycosylase 2 family protein [Rhodovarius crocodyli]|uniref:DNA-3-methyladenine glycosylase II n=1 Tax=Rhodovarius crocodyli TaxID=1979269 RepID=A0A437M396_9PROT|nr:DNA-3-methyladenine glycosylase [Rhodovarius crocodyli]RVT92170.1 DNA-3-methyladenine glycosylase 2 family protein [Rhodovarius crocodyli]